MDRVDSVVVGAGVVGLAIARHLAISGHEVIVLERESAIGTDTSSRNSEVIHAGLYYPTGSLKATMCVEGRSALYDFCQQHGVTHQRLGKLIVATDASQQDALLAIQQKALANGVDDLRLLSSADVQTLEPALFCTAALLSPSTGIIDSHGLMLALLGGAEQFGATLALNSPLVSARITEAGFELAVGGREPMELACSRLINAAGLGAWSVAHAITGLATHHIPQRHLAKGNYYSLNGCRVPFSRLIYPVPEEGGLGVHLTLDLAGQARFGPDVEWVSQIDYQVAPERAAGFYASIRRYWPTLPNGVLTPAYAGIRPKLTGPGQGNADFLIQGPSRHGVPGLVNLFGIESPGLTACLAIAAHVGTMLDG